MSSNDSDQPPRLRYQRQAQYAPIGDQGQEQIANSHVAILGCGALGSVAAEILARAGVGQLTIIDRDVVEWSNLQRQSLFDESDAKDAVTKSQAAAHRLSAINSTIRIEPVVADVTADNIRAVLQNVDLVIDAVDNFTVRFLLNDWSLSTATPWVHGGCVGASGQVRLFDGCGKPCFRCIVPQPPDAASVDTCDTVGVIGSATHLIASLQATEAIKWLSGNQDAVRDNLLAVDLWNNRIREIDLDSLTKGPCIACHDRNLQFLDGDLGRSADGALCGRDAVQISRLASEPIDLDAVSRRWEELGRVQSTPFFVRLFTDNDRTLTLFRDGRVIVNGTNDISEARVLYDRFVGG